MAKYKKASLDMILRCTNCNRIQSPDPEKSNKNWNVYETKCECGGDIEIDDKQFSDEELDQDEELNLERDESMPQCTAKCKATGERCRRNALTGYNVCIVHGAGTRKRVESGERKRPGAPITTGGHSRYMKEEVFNKVKSYQNDPDLEKIDFELAYLKTLPQRVEASSMDESDKIQLLEKTLTSIFNNMEKREKIIESRRYSIGVEKLQLLIKYMFSSVKKHVKDQDVLMAIAQDLKTIASNTKNINENNMIE